MDDDQLTLEEWAEGRGLVPGTVRNWTARADWPAPAGTRETGNRGAAPQEWARSTLDGWWAAHPRLHPPARLRYPFDLGDLVSIGQFAARLQAEDGTPRPVDAKTVRQVVVKNGLAPARPGSPAQYRAGDLQRLMDARPGHGNRTPRRGAG